MDMLGNRRFIIFLAALLVYGVFGSPTPDSLGWVEALVGLGLVFVIGLDGFVQSLAFNHAPFWVRAGRGLLIYGLLFGIGGAVFHAADLRLVIRDLIAFGFLFLPVLLYPHIIKNPQFFQYLVVGAACVGVLFAVRACGDALFGGISWLDGDALYYLGNSPLVLFTALLSIGLAIRALSRSLGVTAWALSGAMAGVCLLGLFTFALSLQRASLAAVCAYTALCLLIATVGCPRRMAFVWLLSGVAAAFWFDDLAAAFSPVFDRLAAKTHLVGANMRIQEWQAVWAQICQSPLTFLFGQGWGGGFSSPAVADIRVNYTHSLFSALLLKTGVVGMALGGVYMIAMLDVIRRLFGRNAFLALALAAPLMIDILFYAAYKSLDFGVLLTLISAAFVCYGNVVRPCGKVYDMDYSTSASVQQGSRHGSQPHSRPFTV